MTISTSLADPLFTVVGSTGAQGGSVIKAITVSSKPYRVRAITRDPTSASAANLLSTYPGIELLAVENVGSLGGARKAFKGAQVVFSMTLTDYQGKGISRDKEYGEGQAHMDAAKAEAVKVVVYSGMPNLEKASGGVNVVELWDVKADITDYGRSLSAFKLIDVQPGAFATNYLTFQAPRKQEDGSFVLGLVQNGDALMPVIDIEEDYGRYVVAALENGTVDTIRAAPAYITPKDIAAIFSKVSGKKVLYSQTPLDVARKVFTAHRGEYVAEILVSMFNAFSTIGYFAGGELESSNALLPAGEPARDFEQFLSANKGVVDKIFL